MSANLEEFVVDDTVDGWGLFHDPCDQEIECGPTLQEVVDAATQHVCEVDQ